MRTLAIGDIHGCSRALDALLAAVDPQSDDLLITLGDYVDRGPDSAGVLDRLLDLRKRFSLVALLGNHDQMMLNAPKGYLEQELWFHCGGTETLASYAEAITGGRFEDVPISHLEFLTDFCVMYYESDSHFFVHANAYPDLPLNEQPDYMLLWERIRDPQPHCSGKIMICGHSSQASGVPFNVGHTICIDTKVYADGWLTCLEVEKGRIWQANQRGKVRTGWLAAC